MQSIWHSHIKLNTLTINYMSTQKNDIIMLYNVSTKKTNIEQINVIIKKTALKISLVYAIR